MNATDNSATPDFSTDSVIATGRPAMSKRQARAAIQARRDGVFDHPDLMRWGPLNIDEEQDCREIAEQAGIAY